MIPSFFGPSQRQLFGMYRPPAGSDRERGVVLCPPLGHEFEFAHWPLRKLTTHLARDGMHVLRFDYTGTGDSAGETESGSPAVWKTDIEIAIEELVELSGLRRISLVGLRLGAALALQVASSMRQVDRVVLWEPVLRGVDYCRELEALEESQRRWSRQPLPQDPDSLMGYPISRSARAQIEAIDLLCSVPDFTGRVVLVESERRQEVQRLASLLEEKAQSVRIEAPPPDPNGGFGEAALRAVATALHRSDS